MTVHHCSVCGAIVPPAAATCRICGTPAVAGMVTASMAEPAPVSRRTGAVAVDMAPLLALVGAGVVLLVTDIGGWWWLVIVVAAIAWVGLLWWWAAADGTGPGKRWLGLVVVQESDGGLLGPAGALGRLVVRGGLCLITIGIAGLSYRSDPEGRERTWWDRICGTRVNEAGDAVRRPSSATALSRWAPVDAGPAPVSSVGPVGSSAAGPPPRWTPSPRHAAAGRGASAPTWSAEPTTPERQIAAHADAAAQETPAGPQRFVPGPVPVPARPARSADQAEFLARPLVGDSTHQVPGVPAHAVPSAPSAPAQLAASAGGRSGSAGGRTAPLGSRGTSASGRSGPTNAGLMITAVPSPSREGVDTAPLAAPAGAGSAGPTAEIIWDTGRSMTINGRALIGRDPVPTPGEQADHLLSVTTESVGVSKTHFQMDVGPAGITVLDRQSRNGVRVISPDGSVRVCPPGVPVSVQVGDAIHFGGRSVTLTG
jgi:hypothetical protein